MYVHHSSMWHQCSASNHADTGQELKLIYTSNKRMGKSMISVTLTMTCLLLSAVLGLVSQITLIFLDFTHTAFCRAYLGWCGGKKQKHERWHRFTDSMDPTCLGSTNQAGYVGHLSILMTCSMYFISYFDFSRLFKTEFYFTPYDCQVQCSHSCESYMAIIVYRLLIPSSWAISSLASSHLVHLPDLPVITCDFVLS